MLKKDDNKEELNLFIANFIIAGATSSVAKTLVAPIDRIKLILQNQCSAIHVITGEREKYKGLVDCFRRIPAEQGVLSLWRGHGTNLLRYIPAQALNFSFHDLFTHQIQKFVGNRENQPKSNYVSYISGALAGASVAFTLYPLKFCQTRLSVDMGSKRKRKKNASETTVAREFTGLADCLKKICKSEGVLGLYKGFTLALMGSAVYRALYFGLFDSLKLVYYENHTLNEKTSTLTKPPFIMEFLFAETVTTISGLVTYPFDTVGRRVMLDSGRPKELKVLGGTWSAFKIICKNEGFSALYKGALTNCLRSTCGALVLVFYDEIKYLSLS